MFGGKSIEMVSLDLRTNRWGFAPLSSGRIVFPRAERSREAQRPVDFLDIQQPKELLQAWSGGGEGAGGSLGLGGGGGAWGVGGLGGWKAGGGEEAFVLPIHLVLRWVHGVGQENGRPQPFSSSVKKTRGGPEKGVFLLGGPFQPAQQQAFPAGCVCIFFLVVTVGICGE